MISLSAVAMSRAPQTKPIVVEKGAPGGCWMAEVFANDENLPAKNGKSGSAVRTVDKFKLKLIFSATTDVASSVLLESKAVSASSDFFCESLEKQECQLANDHGRFRYAVLSKTQLEIQPFGQWSIDRSLEEDDPLVAIRSGASATAMRLTGCSGD